MKLKTKTLNKLFEEVRGPLIATRCIYFNKLERAITFTKNLFDLNNQYRYNEGTVHFSYCRDFDWDENDKKIEFTSKTIYVYINQFYPNEEVWKIFKKHSKYMCDIYHKG